MSFAPLTKAWLPIWIKLASGATLIVGPSWVGDMVMAQSLFKHLKSQDPEIQLDVVAPPWSLSVVSRMPEIREGIVSDVGHGELGLGKRWRLAKKLRGSNYQRAIVIPRSFKSALMPWFANIPVRTGFLGELRYVLINDERKFDGRILNQTVKRYVTLGLATSEQLPDILNPSLSVSRNNQQRLISGLSLSLEKPIIAVMPGAEYGPAKCWPLEYFAELVAQLEDSGYAVWVLGSQKDASAGSQVVGAGGALNLCGKTSLADVIDLLALCDRAISNDSGLMHIAAAVGIHVQGIFGSSSPYFTPPLTEHKNIHYLDLECSPCFERLCPLGHLRCLKDISPAMLVSHFADEK